MNTTQLKAAIAAGARTAAEAARLSYVSFKTRRGHMITVAVPKYLDQDEFWVEDGGLFHEDVRDENGLPMAVSRRSGLRFVDDFSTPCPSSSKPDDGPYVVRDGKRVKVAEDYNPGPAKSERGAA